MSDVDKISKELSEISITHSSELIEAAEESNQMAEFADRLSESADRALVIKEMLQNVNPTAVTVSFGSAIDKQLNRIGVMDVINKTSADVLGAEALGRTLMPSAYLQSRIAGCESFIGDALSKAKKMLIAASEGIRDRYILIKESNRSLARRILLVEEKLSKVPGPLVHGQFKIKLDRNPRLFLVDGVVKEQWGAQLERVDKSISALMSNYYKNNRSSINELLSYFGGFSHLEEDRAIERLLSMPSMISHYTFKECLYPNRELSKDGVKVMQSVELMGGRRFLNAVYEKKPKQLESLEELSRYFTQILENEYVKFVATEKVELNKDIEISSLSTLEIKVILKLCSGILDKTESLFSEGDQYSVEGKDYLEMINVISDNNWDDKLKSTVVRYFEQLALKYNKEMLNNRVAVVEYLTLLINGLLNIAERSIDGE